MLRIQKLRRPNKRSGHLLEPGKNTKVRGIYMVNQNSFGVYVDKFTPQAQLAKNKKKARKKK